MADEYVPLSGFGIGPYGFSTSSAYTANHALHGTLGNTLADGFWFGLRNPIGVADTGSYLDLGANTNGQWLPNRTTPPTETSSAWHKPGDTHPANRAWQVSQQGALRQSFEQYRIAAEVDLRISGISGDTILNYSLFPIFRYFRGHNT